MSDFYPSFSEFARVNCHHLLCRISQDNTIYLDILAQSHIFLDLYTRVFLFHS